MALFFGLLVVIAFHTAVWGGRAEFRLGGDGIGWREFMEEHTGTYVLVDEEGGVLKSVEVTTVPEHPGEAYPGEATVLDYSGGSIRPLEIFPDENLALSAEGRGGHLMPSSHRAYVQEESKTLRDMIDGDPTTAMFRPVPVSPFVDGINNAWIQNSVLNLGVELPVNRIRFYPRPGFEDNYLQWYEIGVAADSAPLVRSHREVSPTRHWYRHIGGRIFDSIPIGEPNDPSLDILASTRENLDADVDLTFPTRDVRWVALRPLDPERDWEVAELEVYGEGFVTRTLYRSGILDFGGDSDRPVAWSKIRWDGEQPPGTSVLFRTRTGKTDDPNLYFALGNTGTFEPVTAEDYLQQWRGVQPYTTDRIGGEAFAHLKSSPDVDNWAFWSEPYDFEAGLRDPAVPAEEWSDGTPVLSPSPSRFLQFEIVMIADRGGDPPRLDELSILFSDQPAAQDVTGEIWPIETDSFEPHTFTYFISPYFGRPGSDSEVTGFDRLEILTGVRAGRVDSVNVGGAELIGAWPEEDLEKDLAGVEFRQGVPYDIQDDRIIVGFDPLGGDPGRDNFKIVKVVFDAKVLRYGAEFAGWVYDSDAPFVKQRINEGNATVDVGGDVLTVKTPIGGDLILGLPATPAVFTPNGDGINDEVTFSYNLRNVETQAALKIYTLSGQLVVELPGKQSWDGKDAAARPVPPGIYLFAVDVDADEERQVATGVVSLAY